MLYVNKANETMAPNLISARLVFSTGVIFPISSILVLLVIFKRDCCTTVARYLYDSIPIFKNYNSESFFLAISTYDVSISKPMKSTSSFLHATAVEPIPMKGSIASFIFSKP